MSTVITIRPALEGAPWNVEVTFLNGDDRKFVDAERIDVSDGVLIIQLDENRGIRCFPLDNLRDWSVL